MLDDDEDDVELLDFLVGVDDAQCVPVVTDGIETNKIGHSVVKVPSKETTQASKAPSRLAKRGPLEKEATVQLSARTLALIRAKQEAKTRMRLLLVQEKMDAYASIQREKTKVQMEMLAASLARQDARAKKAQEELERRSNVESLKRIVDMRDRYLERGLSLRSAMAKSELCEKLLLED